MSHFVDVNIADIAPAPSQEFVIFLAENTVSDHPISNAFSPCHLGSAERKKPAAQSLPVLLHDFWLQLFLLFLEENMHILLINQKVIDMNFFAEGFTG